MLKEVERGLRLAACVSPILLFITTPYIDGELIQLSVFVLISALLMLAFAAGLRFRPAEVVRSCYFSSFSVDADIDRD